VEDLRMRHKLLVWTMAAVLGLAAAPARAVTYEDSFEQCNYPKTFDLMIMRPISLLTVVGGGLLFLPLAPLALLTVPREVGSVWESMVVSPARFTFDRQLGECTSIDLSY
jgi:hypothetical protein